jgi:hypothetical protein
MICEFQKQHTLDYEMKTAAVLKQVTDRKKTVNEKNTSTALDKTDDDIQEARDDNACDDAEEEDDASVVYGGLTEEDDFEEVVLFSKKSSSSHCNVSSWRTCGVQKDHHHAKRRHSGCAPALREMSPRPQPEDQDSKSHP